MPISKSNIRRRVQCSSASCPPLAAASAARAAEVSLGFALVGKTPISYVRVSAVALSRNPNRVAPTIGATLFGFREGLFGNKTISPALLAKLPRKYSCNSSFVY